MNNLNTLEELKEAYKDYKKGKYTFGNYGTGDQIERAFLDGKIFVLRASNSVWCLLVVFLTPVPFLFLSIGGASFSFLLNYWGIIFMITGIFIFLLIFELKRNFLVIGPSGVYYRRVIKTGYFQWSKVNLAKASIHTRQARYDTSLVTSALVTIILPTGKKIEFSSIRYQSKEFVRKAKRAMFLRLFQIYSELGTNITEN